MASLNSELVEHYIQNKYKIKQRLADFANVQEVEYFYELCYCICTPQSSARNADKVVQKLKSAGFLKFGENPVGILMDKEHYIRFHNTKAQRLLKIRNDFPEIAEILSSKRTPAEKRLWLVENINGFGFKEASHFLRNIGFTGLTILDRHILKHLALCGVIEPTKSIGNKNTYLKIEEEFLKFARDIGISVDELDLLYWSYETGEILK